MKPACAAFALSLAALILAACGRSPRTQFFVLSPVRPAASQAHFAGAPVQVTAVHLPETLDRLQRVTLEGARLDVHELQQWGAPLADMTRQILSQDLAARLPAGMLIAPDSPATHETRSLVVTVQRFAPDAQGQVVLEASWTLLPAPASAGAAGSGQGSAAGRQGGGQGSGQRGGLLSRWLDGSHGNPAGKRGSASTGGAAAADAAAQEPSQPPLLTGQHRYERAAGANADAQVDAMSDLLGELADTLAMALRSAGT